MSKKLINLVRALTVGTLKKKKSWLKINKVGIFQNVVIWLLYEIDYLQNPFKKQGFLSKEFSCILISKKTQFPKEKK